MKSNGSSTMCVVPSRLGMTVLAAHPQKPVLEAAALQIRREFLLCKERLAAYKYPRSLEVRESLPKTATGKILKRALRA
jgi:long-chain acyl-CoA synthetase